MCRFKSGIILKRRVVIAPGGDDSHSTLLENMGIEDNYINASKVFVRAELVPQNDEWGTSPEEHPDKWKFIVDQDIIPDWFDKEEHEKVFRESVCDWWKQHVLIGQKNDELSSGYYRLKRCEVKTLCKDVQVMLDSSMVREMRDDSMVREMRNSSTVHEMYDSSTVQAMYNDSIVRAMWDNSTVRVMYDSSIVHEMLDSSTVREMWDNSTVRVMHDSSIVRAMWDNSTVQVMYNSSTVHEMYDSSIVREMRNSSIVRVMLGNSTVHEMLGNSTARSFKVYPKIQIFVPDAGEFEMVVFKNKSED